MLNREELELLEEDFKHFLIVHGVHDPEWRKMNADHPDQAQELVGLFSDTVLQKVYEKVRFLEHRKPQSCMVFHFSEAQVSLISINAKSDAVDLSTPEGIHAALVHTADLLTFFQSKKEYSKPREEEIHQMLEQGCVNSSEAFWMQLEKALN